MVLLAGEELKISFPTPFELSYQSKGNLYLLSPRSCSSTPCSHTLYCTNETTNADTWFCLQIEHFTRAKHGFLHFHQFQYLLGLIFLSTLFSKALPVLLLQTWAPNAILWGLWTVLSLPMHGSVQWRGSRYLREGRQRLSMPFLHFKTGKEFLNYSYSLHFDSASACFCVRPSIC